MLLKLPGYLCWLVVSTALKNLNFPACGRCLGDARWHRLGAPQHPGDQRNALLVLVAMEMLPKSGENQGKMLGKSRDIGGLK